MIVHFRDSEPCTCGHGLGRHLTTTGRPCEIRECDCERYVKAPKPSRWATGRRV